MTLNFSMLGRHKPTSTLSKPDRPDEYIATASPRPGWYMDMYTCQLYCMDMPVPDQCYCLSPIPFTPVRVPLPVPPELPELSTSKTTSPLRPVQETMFCQCKGLTSLYSIKFATDLTYLTNAMLIYD